MIAHWYRVALATGDQVRLVVAPGAHLGEALAHAARRVGGPGLVPIAAAHALAGEVPLGESVGKGVVIERGVPSGLHRFAYPSGVIAAIDGGGRTAAMAPGYRRLERDGSTVIEAVAAGTAAREAFLDVIERLAAVDNVEVRIASHHDGADHDEVWLTPRLGDVRRALKFLDDFDVDLLDNGHVDVSIYVRAPRSTWRLTQHKGLLLISEDPTLPAKVESWLASAGLAPVADLAAISRIGHLHYRPAASSSRERLRTRLRKAGLRPVATVRDGVSTPIAPRA